MRRLKQILITLCVATGGVGLTGAVYADESWQDDVDVQFTFDGSLTMAVTGGHNNTGNAVIPDMMPGQAKRSVDLTITVNTNNGGGYVLSAKVGVNDGVHDSNSLVGTAGTFASLASDASYTLTSSDFGADYWGFTTATGDDATFSGLSYNADRVLRTTKSSNDVATTTFAIGAKASTGKAGGTYTNTVTFTAVANMVTKTVTTAAGTNAATAIIGTTGSVVTGAYNTGDQIDITATCDSGYVFGGWMRSGDYGTFVDANAASTKYTVGNDDVTLTAYCIAE